MHRQSKTTTTLAALAGIALSATCAHASLLVYEPFDYAGGGSTPLTGQGGAVGTAGTWNSFDSGGGASWDVHNEGTASGVLLSGANPSVDPSGPSPFNGTVDNLVTSGGYAGYKTGGNNLNADIGLAASVTASFTSGSTTWISYVSARAWDRNEEHANLVLGTDPAPNGSRGDNYGGIGTGGSGFGTGGGPTRNNRTDIYPMFYNAGQYSNWTGDVAGNSYGDGAHEVLPADGLDWVELDADGFFGAPNIVVMKLEWDADTGGQDIMSLARFLEGDVISEANFDAMIAAQPNLSSANWADAEKPSLDQSQLDTITLMGTKYFVDEIRLATTFDEAAPFVIPEPSSFALMGLGLLSFLGYRRRK